MLKAIGNNTQAKRLNFRNRFLLSVAVSKRARDFEHFGDPAPVVFLFSFNGEFRGALLSARVNYTSPSTNFLIRLPVSLH